MAKILDKIRRSSLTVPQGVRCAGSHDVMPVRIVSVNPSEILIRWTAGSAGPCSLHAIRCVGFRSLGQSAIMSMLGPRFDTALTTRIFSPFATVMSDVGSASAVAALTLAVEDCAIGSTIPNNCGLWASS